MLTTLYYLWSYTLIHRSNALNCKREFAGSSSSVVGPPKIFNKPSSPNFGLVGDQNPHLLLTAFNQGVKRDNKRRQKKARGSLPTVRAALLYWLCRRADIVSPSLQADVAFKKTLNSTLWWKERSICTILMIEETWKALASVRGQPMVTKLWTKLYANIAYWDSSSCLTQVRLKTKSFSQWFSVTPFAHKGRWRNFHVFGALSLGLNFNIFWNLFAHFFCYVVSSCVYDHSHPYLVSECLFLAEHWAKCSDTCTFESRFERWSIWLGRGKINGNRKKTPRKCPFQGRNLKVTTPEEGRGKEKVETFSVAVHSEVGFFWVQWRSSPHNLDQYRGKIQFSTLLADLLMHLNTIPHLRSLLQVSHDPN